MKIALTLSFTLFLCSAASCQDSLKNMIGVFDGILYERNINDKYGFSVGTYFGFNITKPNQIEHSEAAIMPGIYKNLFKYQHFALNLIFYLEGGFSYQKYSYETKGNTTYWGGASIGFEPKLVYKRVTLFIRPALGPNINYSEQSKEKKITFYSPPPFSLYKSIGVGFSF